MRGLSGPRIIDKLRRPDRQELCIRFNTNGRSACSDLGSSQSRAHILSLTCRPTLDDFLVPFLSIFHLDSRLLGKYNLNESYLQFAIKEDPTEQVAANRMSGPFSSRASSLAVSVRPQAPREAKLRICLDYHLLKTTKYALSLQPVLIL